MPYVRTFAVVALLGAALPAASVPPAPVAAPAAPVTAPAPAQPSFGVPVVVVHGAYTRLPLGAGRGWLDVFVERTTGPDGAVTVEGRYERSPGCTQDPGAIDVVCEIAWTHRRPVPAGAFTVSGDLATATLTATVAGRLLTVTWTATAAERRSVNENGSLLFRIRRGVAEIRWGDVHYVQPPPGPQDEPSGVFERTSKARRR